MENKTAQTTKSIARNVYYGFLTWIVPLCLGFVATPVIIRALGDEDYGIYALVLTFVGYSFTFSIGRAITKYIAEYRANGETEKIRDVVSATFFINIVVGVFGVLMICLLANWLVRDIFKIEPNAQEKTVLALYLASGIVFLTMLTQVFSAVLQGLQRFDVYSKIFNASSFVLLLGNLVLAFLGYGLLALFIWNLLIISIFCVIYAVCAKRLLPEFGLSFRFTSESLRLVTRYSLGIIGYQIAANLLLLFERIWITRHLGPQSLTYYVVPMTLGIYMHGFVSSLVLVIFPLASELKNEKEKLLRLYTKATKIVSVLTVFLATTLIVENRFFLFLWLGENFAEKSSDLLVLHTITFALAAISAVSWQMTEGLGFPNYNFGVFLICLVVSLVLMITLTQNFGSFGIASARLAGFATIFFSVFYVEKWFFGKIQVGFWMKLTSVLAVAAVFAALVEFFVINYLPVSWLTFVLSAACGGIVYCAVLWLLDFITADEKILIRGILNR